MSPWEPAQRSARRWLGLPPRIAVGFAIAFVSIVAAGVFASRALVGLRSAGELVAEESANELAIEHLESALLTADVALDAYLGSREERHEQRHLRAAGKIAPALATLERLATEDGGSNEKIARLRRLVETVQAEQTAVRTLALSGRIADARALRVERMGELERAKAEIDALELEHARKHEVRRDGWARGVAAWKFVFGVSLASIAVLLLLGVRVVRDEVRARERHEHERERAIAVQQRVMAVVSHDLRNPLASIVTSGWTLSRMEMPRESALVVRRILGAGRRMERLIRDLLDWSRVHGGAEIPVHVCEADLYEVCRRIAEELGDRHGGRIQVERRGDTRGTFDPDRMEQVVGNLVANALQYTPPESTVRVRAEGEEDGSVRLVVHDDGPGLPPGAREDLFKPFHRGTAHGDRSGLGLGLFIVRTLAEAQGGRVDVQSAPGAGTTFVVTVPAAHGAAPTAPASARC